MYKVIETPGGPLRSCRVCHHWYPDRGQRVEVDGVAHSVNLCSDCEPSVVDAVKRQKAAESWDMCEDKVAHNW